MSCHPPLILFSGSPRVQRKDGMSSSSSQDSSFDQSHAARGRVYPFQPVNLPLRNCTISILSCLSSVNLHVNLQISWSQTQVIMLGSCANVLFIKTSACNFRNNAEKHIILCIFNFIQQIMCCLLVWKEQVRTEFSNLTYLPYNVFMK